MVFCTPFMPYGLAICIVLLGISGHSSNDI